MTLFSLIVSVVCWGFFSVLMFLFGLIYADNNQIFSESSYVSCTLHVLWRMFFGATMLVCMGLLPFWLFLGVLLPGLVFTILVERFVLRFREPSHIDPFDVMVHNILFMLSGACIPAIILLIPPV